MLKAATVVIPNTQPQVRLDKHGDLAKLAKKMGIEVFEGPDYDFVPVGGFLVFAKNPKKK